MRHIIRRQVLETKLAKSDDAFHRQNELSQFYWRQILPALERVFDELADEDELLQLDRMELDLGQLKTNSIGADLSSAIYHVILQQVRERIAEEKRRKDHHRPKSIAAQWLFYMRHGRLDWNTIEVNEVWHLKVLEAFATDYHSISALRSTLLTDRRSLERIVLYHDEQFLVRLMEVLTAKAQPGLLTVIEEINIILQSTGIHTTDSQRSFIQSRKHIWMKTLYLVAKQKENLTEAELQLSILDSLIEAGTRRTILQRWGSDERHSKLVQKLGKRWNAIEEKLIELREEDSEQQSNNDHDRSNLHAEQSTTANDSVNLIDNGKLEKTSSGRDATSHSLTSDEHQERRTDNALLNEGIFVQHAGLVLLHPFLSSLLTKLQFVKEGVFVSRETQERSLYLLHFLATGKDAQAEHELLMPKILLAFPLEDIPRPGIILTAEERQEADSLLTAVIDHWSILRSTSIEGLREGFLQRQGKYGRQNDNYLLQVEQGSIDMLLDHLPWNLSIIKLPWMSEMIRVDWR